MTTTHCGACGEPLGSSPKCQDCMLFNAEQQASTVKESDVSSVLDRVANWIEEKGGPGIFFRQVKLLFELLRDWYNNRYEGLSWQSIALIVATLHYVITPFDMIPDWIFVIGWFDDATMVTALFKSLHDDIAAYVKHRGLDREEFGV